MELALVIVGIGIPVCLVLCIAEFIMEEVPTKDTGGRMKRY